MMTSDQELSAAFADTPVIMVILLKEKCNEQKENLVKKMADKYSKICYITTNKPYCVLVDEFRKSNIPPERFIFIDATPGGDSQTVLAESCIIIGSPNDFNTLNIRFSQLLNKVRFEHSIFDSIDTCEIYSDLKTVIKFVHSIITKIRMAKSKIILLTCESGDIPKELYMFVDKVVKFSS